jgi:FAD/FMN-containing dehydrogenase
MAAMSHLATGISLADENLCRRPARFIAESNMARLDKVRSAYDPDGRFHSWMGGV